jgi:hypothetical protein
MIATALPRKNLLELFLCDSIQRRDSSSVINKITRLPFPLQTACSVFLLNDQC